MNFIQAIFDFFMKLIHTVYNFLWGDLFTLPLPGGGGSVGIPLLVIILIPAGLWFTVRTRFLAIRLFPDMLRIAAEKRPNRESGAISGLQALFTSVISLSHRLSLQQRRTLR